MAQSTITVGFDQETKRRIDKLIKALEKTHTKEDPLLLTDLGTISIQEILDVLPNRTVIAGPEFHDEIYQKSGTVWYGVGSNVPWDTASLAERGPFSVLRRGEGSR